MSLLDVQVKPEYRSFSNDVVREFYIPCLRNAVMYKRAVGFFSSTALVEISEGISGLIRNNGKMRLIVSPELDSEDIEAMRKGYAARESVIEAALLKKFTDPESVEDEERLNWLAYLIESNRLEIKVAYTIPEDFGLYHEKMGIICDADGNKIAFSGSMNETRNALRNNYESIDVFCPWNGEEERVESKDRRFDRIWNDQETGIDVIDFPRALKDHLLRYRKPTINLDFDDRFEAIGKPIKRGPDIPSGLELHDYQVEAINKWAEQGYRGIFSMATGTGKTYTALGAAIRLLKDKERAAIFIVCPFQHLVEQWVEDIEKFGFKPIIGYSSSEQKDWKTRLSTNIKYYNNGIENQFCFVTTVATYCSDYVTEQMQKIKVPGNILLIADEAHNLGGEKVRRSLHDFVDYRIALSATIERHDDEEGTGLLLNYFGERCIEYTIKEAIRDGRLTPYEYHPVVTNLTVGEFEAYVEITREIACCQYKDKNGRVVLTEKGKRLLIKRSRIVAGAANKISLLEELLKPYKDDCNILVYCGSTVLRGEDDDESEADYEGERQIDAVSKMMGQLGMKVRHFTSRETAQEREEIKVQFANSEPYQALVAIKCLDEGVNIPGIKTAFILASCTNPKEYIQRRGRVLRTAPGKNEAVIYDFITLPRPMEEAGRLDPEYMRHDVGLVKREIKRMREFADAACNSSETDRLIDELADIYKLNLYSLDGEDYNDEL